MRDDYDIRVSLAKTKAIRRMRVGVLALQGAFIEHEQKLRELGVEAVEVRLPHDLNGLNGLIIPGGESTTIGKLASDYGLIEPLRQFAQEKPTWGTCAGMIFLAKDIGIDRQPILGVMDITVNRNAFGRQVDSFERDLSIAALGEQPYHAVFIRAPIVTSAGSGVDVLATLDDGRIVAVQQGHLLATAFHPELTRDLRLHEYFVANIPTHIEA
jgi:5'-phosphate synthase pdxT subunit